MKGSISFKNLTDKVLSSVEAEILMRVLCPLHTLHKFYQLFMNVERNP
jgi:hypothetical protein